MTTSTREITAVSFGVSQDPGHGGGRFQYRVDRTRGGCDVTASISRLTPAPGEGSFLPGMMTQPLPKDGPEVDDFLSRLALVYKVFELEGRACPHALLHPTFYSFCFTDSEGNSHKFDYSIEAGRHHDDTYRELVEEFERFFEVRRVARSLYEDASRPPEPPGRPTWGKRINWWLRFLISRLR